MSIWTVAREVGHKDTDMIERVYGHLGTVRRRAKAVEYRVSHHKRTLAKRLAALRRSVTTCGTTGKPTV